MGYTMVMGNKRNPDSGADTYRKRITLDLPTDVYEALRLSAFEQRKTMLEVATEHLRRGLNIPTPLPAASEAEKPPG